jgi:drug/metabolite transporter (DMT)-like permease
MSPPPGPALAIPSELSSPAGVRAASQAPPPASAAAVASPRAATSPAATLVLALFAVYLIWGSTYLVMKIAVETLPPMLMGAARFSIAGGILLVIGRAREGRWPAAREWLAALPVGVLLFVAGNGFVALAETEVSSGIAALFVATMPLWMALFGTALGERLRTREWAGIAVGVTGVVILVSGRELSAAPTATLVLALSPVSWALGSTIARRTRLAPGLLGTATQQVLGGLAMTVAGLARGERWPAVMTFDAWWTLSYLIVFGSLIAFTAYAWLLRNTRPAIATSYAFVNPPLAVLLGAALGAEAIHTETLLAAPVVIAAVVLVVGRPRPPAPIAAPAATRR